MPRCPRTSWRRPSILPPQVAILLNITPDHISWHGGFDAYAQAKFKVFENMEAGSTAIVGASVLDAYPELQALLEGRAAGS